VSTRPRTAAVLSLLLAGPLLLGGCGEQEGTSEAGASSAATQQPASEGASETVTEGSEPDADAPPFVADSEADTEAASADASLTVSDIRIGGHDGFDRVVFELGGTGTPGWNVQYVDAASSQGSGTAVGVTGDAILQVTLTGAGYPYDTGVEEFARGPLTSAESTVVSEVVWDATFEGTSVAFIGATAKYPFRVYALTDPARVVVEVAHAAG
jgi:hypothetical protein